MAFAAWWGILNLVLTVALLAAVVYLFVLIVRALKKCIGSKEMREEKQAVKRTADFTHTVTAYSYAQGLPPMDGIAFEPYLHELEGRKSL